MNIYGASGKVDRGKDAAFGSGVKRGGCRVVRDGSDRGGVGEQLLG